MSDSTYTLPTRYDFCNVCGSELGGFTKAMGVCHSCVADSADGLGQGIPKPSYAFNQTESEDDEQEEELIGNYDT